MTILETSSGEPCIDELEVWTDAPPPVNVALSSAGAQVRAAGSLPGYQIHQLTGINDGIYGNGSSWIADEISDSWVEVELQEVARIKRIVWSRDREGNFVDRLITRYRIEVADESGAWRQVASSENRRPLGFESQFIGSNPASNLSVYRFASFSSEMQDPPNIRQSTMFSTTGERSTEHGLPNNNVASIIQSMDSIVWTLNPGNDSLDSLATYIPK